MQPARSRHVAEHCRSGPDPDLGSNASTKGPWNAASVDLSAYAGQTITLKFQAINDSTLPTSFYVDVVSVLA